MQDFSNRKIEINAGVQSQAEDLLLGHEHTSDQAALELLRNLPSLINRDRARAFEAIRTHEAAGRIGKMLFDWHLRKDPRLKDAIASVKAQASIDEAKLSAIQNEGRHIIN
jgi:hypothetical protein